MAAVAAVAVVVAAAVAAAARPMAIQSASIHDHHTADQAVRRRRAIRPAQVGFPPLLKQVQATLKAHDLQPGRYVLPQIIITPVG